MITKIENGIEYTLKKDIWYPILRTKEAGICLRKYGIMRKEFLAQNHQAMYEQMVLAGNLYSHCKEVENQAKEWKERIIAQCMAKGLSIQSAYNVADEIIQKDLIFV